MTQAKNHETTEQLQGVIVIGLDEKAKPRAARFAAPQVALATKAADLMGLTVCPITTELVEMSKKLPGGRIYSSGAGFVPHIKKNLFDKLVEAAGITISIAAPTNSMPATSLPSGWDDIDVGKLVLAQDNPTDGWWEAVVIEKADDSFTLRWRDYPKDDPFKRTHAFNFATQVTRDLLSWKENRIRALNDQFRETLIGGRAVMTSGIAALGETLIARIIQNVRSFTGFDVDNDPRLL
jgi:hypothetical protein